MICVKGWGLRGKGCCLDLSQFHEQILSSKRGGGCVGIAPVLGAHSNTLKGWMAQIDESGPTAFV